MKVLITAGGMEEKIDDVRYIGNYSSGKTGATIADYLAQQKAQVYLLSHKKAIRPQNDGIKIENYTSFSDLELLLTDYLGKISFDLVIHAAAVSDYSVDYLLVGEKRYSPGQLPKLDSKAPISIMLKSNPKLLQKIRPLSINKRIQVVAFKLTVGGSPKEAIDKILRETKIDLLVHNDLNEINGEKHLATILNHQGEFMAQTTNNLELAAMLYQLTGKLI